MAALLTRPSRPAEALKTGVYQPFRRCGVAQVSGGRGGAIAKSGTRRFHLRGIETMDHDQGAVRQAGLCDGVTDPRV